MLLASQQLLHIFDIHKNNFSPDKNVLCVFYCANTISNTAEIRCLD